MLHAMDKFSSLRYDTKVFCGHEYTLKNLEFCLKVNGENKLIKDAANAYSELINDKGRHSVLLPSNVTFEKNYNVFMQCREPEV